MSKMTDNHIADDGKKVEEVIKALECHTHGKESNLNCCDCDYIQFQDCSQRMSCDALDLINRQQSAIDVYMQENDRLKTAYIQVSMDRKEAVTEAIKEFAERLKENTVIVKIGKQNCKVITVDGIDYYKKEMVG